MTRTGRAILTSIAAGAALLALLDCARRPPKAIAPVTRTVRGGEVTEESGRVARVALALDAAAPTIGATGEWGLFDQTGHQLLGRNATGSTMWRVERRGLEVRAVGPGGATAWQSGPLVVRAVGDAFVTYGGHRWRGEMWAHPSTAGVTVVNRVAVESYLRGVVPLELDTFGPSDVAALQAQSVAARSYVYSRLPEFQPRDVAIRQAALPYDLRATTSDQVYGGVDAERTPSDRAVRSTAGLVLRYGGAVVTAPYHSSCGGSTAEAQELWRSEAEPWLQRVSDRIPGSTNRYYCDIAPHFQWTRTWDEATLRGVLEKYLRASSGVRPPLNGLRAISIASHTASGRVGTLVVSTDAGRAELRGNDIRFAVRSVGGDILPSTYFSVDTESDGDGRLSRITIRGNGNGHGVGMCQWGAVGRARAGQDFRAILRAYFPSASVESAE